jgi:hypothetical protein
VRDGLDGTFRFQIRCSRNMGVAAGDNPEGAGSLRGVDSRAPG